MLSKIFTIAIILVPLYPPILRGLYLYFYYGLSAIISTFIIFTLNIGLAPLHFTFNIFPEDVLFTLLLFIGLLRFLHNPFFFRNKVCILWVLFGFLMFLALVRGLPIFGTSAVVGFRLNYYYWISCFYFLSFRTTDEDLYTSIKLFAKSSLLLVFLAFFRWVSDAAGMSNYSLVGAGLPFRVLTSGATFFISIGAFFYLHEYLFSREKNRNFVYYSLTCFLSILVLQHRSVWLSTLIGFLVLIVIYKNRISRVKTMKLILIAVICVMLSVFVLYFTNSGNKLVSSIEHSYNNALKTSGRGTHIDRVLGWKQLLLDWKASDLTAHLIGFPYGTGYKRYVLGFLREYSPHNFYVQLLLRLGLFGLFLFAISYVWCLNFFKKNKKKLGTTGSVFFIILCSSLVYYIAYQGFYIQGALLGITLSWQMKH